jgi:hypothetical protein
MQRLSDRPNYRGPWSQDDLDRLAEMIAAGSDVPEIADSMGRTQEAIRNRASKSGLLKKRRSRRT